MNSRIFLFLLVLPAGICEAQVPALSAAPAVPGIPTMKAADLFALADAETGPRPPVPAVPAPPPPAGAPEAPPDASIIIQPNPDGILDLAAIGDGETAARDSNPFRVRYHPPAQAREMPLAVESVLVGARPADASAVINGDLYSPGDRLAEMTIAAISPDTLELRRGALLLKIPVQERPTLLRLPR
jgi:hypothetical protein